MSEWFAMLYEARVRLGLSQADLAARSHVSLPSVKSYEQGKRHPSRPYLTAMLDALRVDRSERNAILKLAGYATDGLELGPWLRDGFMFTLDEACDHIKSCPWPASVGSEFLEVFFANDAAIALWGIDLEREFPDKYTRNVLSFATEPRFVDRIVNREEVFAFIAGVFKGHPRGPDSLNSPSAHLAPAVDRFKAGPPEYIDVLVRVWQEAEPLVPRVRWEFPVIWRDPNEGEVRFRGLVTVASEPDGLLFTDWIPTDAASWEVLTRITSKSSPPDN